MRRARGKEKRIPNPIEETRLDPPRAPPPARPGWRGTRRRRRRASWARGALPPAARSRRGRTAWRGRANNAGKRERETCAVIPSHSERREKQRQAEMT